MMLAMVMRMLVIVSVALYYRHHIVSLYGLIAVFLLILYSV